MQPLVVIVGCSLVGRREFVVFLGDLVELVLRREIAFNTGELEHRLDCAEMPLEDVLVHVPEHRGQQQLVQQKGRERGYIELIDQDYL